MAAPVPQLKPAQPQVPQPLQPLQPPLADAECGKAGASCLVSCHPKSPPPPEQVQNSFYRRPLPEPGISFASTEGRRLFQEALASGHMEVYFRLAEQFLTQEEPAFCGLSTLTMVLNALAVDPGRVWKGPWRWVHESMLDCCRPLELVKKEGVTFRQLACLGRCNGAEIDAEYASDASEARFREEVRRICRQTEEFLIVSYSRGALNQTGDGHFSPIGGYHPGRDLVLLLDVARFKYPPHWVPVSALFASMQRTDAVTGLSRGYMVVRQAPATRRALMFTVNALAWSQLRDELATSLPRELSQVEEAAQTSPRSGFRDVVARFVGALEGRRIVSAKSPPNLDSLIPEHRRAMEDLLRDIRATPLFAVVSQAMQGAGGREGKSDLAAEIATMLVLTVPNDVWRGLRESTRSQLHDLTDVNKLTPLLRDEVQMLRRQIREMMNAATD
jgi:glutathione gamma-glutamylcysteinyltransferase